MHVLEGLAALPPQATTSTMLRATTLMLAAEFFMVPHCVRARGLWNGPDGQRPEPRGLVVERLAVREPCLRFVSSWAALPLRMRRACGAELQMAELPP
jgi:hypothetical protein